MPRAASARPAAAAAGRASAASPIRHRWTGVDSSPLPWLAVLQANLTGERIADCLATVSELARTLRAAGAAAGFTRCDPDTAPPTATALIGCSVTLFKGAWNPWRDDSSYSVRWGRDVDCPPSLQTMRAKRDVEFAAFGTEAARLAHETDLCVLVEAADRMVLDRVIGAVAAASGSGMELRGVHVGHRDREPRDPFGFRDGISNLQDMPERDPEHYLEQIFCRSDNGEVAGTYLAFRRYRCYPERLAGQTPIEIRSSRGGTTRMLRPEQVIGRCRQTGLVVHDGTGELLPAEPDQRQGAHAPAQSHLHKANPRGHGRTSLGHPVRVPEARILRRSYPYAITDPDSGEPERGLLFLAFQSDIQHRGFEFIHNEWLMSDFNGAPDPLLAPEAGLVEPLTGCYYYLPRQQRDIAAELASMLS